MGGAEFAHDVETALVTGATGQVGARVVDRLADAGVDVTGVDRTAPADTRSNATFRAFDLAEQGPTWETVSEVDPDAVVHLAAAADPERTPGTTIFENNVQSTYNVLEAAGSADADVVWTSSQAVYGALFAPDRWVPDALPIRETHELRPADPYGCSKECCESIAATVSRRYGVDVTTLRPATVFSASKTRQRPHDDAADLSEDPRGGDFGAYVDVRDLARAIEAGLAADHDGHAICNVAADDNYLGQPTAEIVAATCGEVPTDCDLDGTESPLANDRAKATLGWEPAFAWGDRESSDATEPAWL
ncbi:NAD(P)-dependent oxidoreductase [Salinarchaeum chitinilyticum]